METVETPQPTQPTESKSTAWTKIIVATVVGLGLLAGTAYAGYYYGTQQVQPVTKPTPVVSQPTPKPTPTPTPTPLVEDETKGWKAYTNSDFVKYQVSYPPSWTAAPLVYEGRENLKLTPPAGDGVNLDCPRGDGKYRTELPNPKEWEPNEGGWTTKYYKEVEINGMQAVQYVWGGPTEGPLADDTTATLFTALKRSGNPLVCEFGTTIGLEDGNYEKLIDSKEIYNQILSTFKFLD